MDQKIRALYTSSQYWPDFLLHTYAFLSVFRLWVCVSVGVEHSSQRVHECEAVHTDVEYVLVSR